MPVLARRLPSGTIVVEVSVGDMSGRTVVVSSYDQQPDPGAQAGRMTTWCGRHALRVGEVVDEVGFGMSAHHRPVFCVTPRSGRLWSSTGVGWPVSGSGTRALCWPRMVVGSWWSSPRQRTDDLVGDMVEVLTGMCACLYGRRGARNRTMRVVTATKGDSVDEVPV
jgi:putative resolvase